MDYTTTVDVITVDLLVSALSEAIAA